MCQTWDVDRLLEAIPNRKFVEWLVYWNVKADREKEAFRRMTKKGSG